LVALLAMVNLLNLNLALHLLVRLVVHRKLACWPIGLLGLLAQLLLRRSVVCVKVRNRANVESVNQHNAVALLVLM